MGEDIKSFFLHGPSSLNGLKRCGEVISTILGQRGRTISNLATRRRALESSFGKQSARSGPRFVPDESPRVVDSLKIPVGGIIGMSFPAPTECPEFVGQS